MADSALVIEPFPPYTYPSPAVADQSIIYDKSNVYDKSREEFFISYTLFFEDVFLNDI